MNFTDHPCTSDLLGSACLAALWPWLIGAAAIVILVFAWRLWRRPGGLTALVNRDRPDAPSRDHSVLARLIVEQAGPELTGKRIPLAEGETILGRNPDLSDVQLYDSRGVSTVSGRHCTIRYDGRRRRFLLSDDGSTNGTVVNGAQLLPANPRELRHGDVILLGDPRRNGARLRFLTAEPAGERPVRSGASTLVEEKPARLSPRSRPRQEAREENEAMGLATVYDLSLDEETGPEGSREDIISTRDETGQLPRSSRGSSGQETLPDHPPLKPPDLAEDRSAPADHWPEEQEEHKEGGQDWSAEGDGEDEDAWLDYL